MIKFDKTTLANGLTVLVHEDGETPLLVVNLLYNVGAKDENESRTGFAHLFEHLMFGGSFNAPEFDSALQLAGGYNNAFTSNDFTNYYNVLPAVNIETALWLESDRMTQLNINPKSLGVQKSVVSEEFKENYLNQPYGDAWHKLRSMAYTVHPYKWPTIGQNLKHIEDAGIDEVKAFYLKYYQPSNAILSISGGIEAGQAMELANKWMGHLPDNPPKKPPILREPVQSKEKRREHTAKVPLNAIYKAFHMVERTHPDYYPTDLVSDILSNGPSSRLYQSLVKEKKLFNHISASITGSNDPGLFIVQGMINDGVSIDTAEKELNLELMKLADTGVNEHELQKVKNKVGSHFEFEKISLENRSFLLSYYELLGDAGMINTESEKYQSIRADKILENAQSLFRPENSSTLIYKTENLKA